MIWLVVAATVVQLGGIAITVVALSRTWQNRTYRAHFSRALLGRQEEAERHYGRLASGGSGSTESSAVISTQPDPNESWQDQLERERKRIDIALDEAKAADRKAAAAQSGVDALSDRVTTELQTAENRLRDWVRDELARGVPMATWGVIITVLGTVLQSVVSALQA